MKQQPSRSRLRPVIRVFVSSTFSDLKHERDALQREVFPRLEQLCASRQFQFQAIDLRWGISSEAGDDHRTMRICFDELRRSQEVSPEPNFLILLGHRYGMRPLPEAISQAEYDQLAAAAEFGGEHRTPIPGTHGKTALQVLRDWYRCDENVLLPVPPNTEPDRAPLNYILQPRTQDLQDGRDYTRTNQTNRSYSQDWRDVQQVLRRIIDVAFPAESLDHRFDHLDWPQHVASVTDRRDPKPVVPQIVRFQASATEQEIWAGALSVPNAERHVLAFFRDITNRDDFAPEEARDFFDLTETRELDEAAAKRQNALRTAIAERLGEDATVPVPYSRLKREGGKVVVDASEADTKAFCDAVFERFRSIVERQIDAYWRETGPASVDRAARDLEIEQREYERFAEERGGEETFVGRHVELQAILDYVGSDSPWPLVIHGASGCGKTALLARASQEVAKTRERIDRFIAVTPRSSDLRSLLSSLCQELRHRNPRADPLPLEMKELRDEFLQHLQAATPEQPLILFLDALDQLADVDNGRLLHWLPPGELPAHVKLLVSCLSDRANDDPAGQPYAELKRRPIPVESLINLDAVSETEARRLLFDRWLAKAGRTVSDEQRVRIEQRLSSPACRQPIYLKLLFDEVQLWRSYDPPVVLGESVPALLGQLFDRLSQPTNHGPVLVNRVLGYLSASRHGLAENEILEILFADPEYKAKLNEASAQTRHALPPNATRIPIALWSRLRFDLAPYLTERAAPGANVIAFYHRQFGDAVRHKYLNGDNNLHFHRQLAGYFQAHDYFLESVEQQQARAKRLPPTPRPANARKVVELPWQRIEEAKLSGSWDTVETLFTDLSFLEAKAEAGMVFDLATEFTQVEAQLPAERASWRIVRLLREAVWRDCQFIARYPTTLFQCLWNSGWWYDCAEAAAYYDSSDGPWNEQEEKLSQLLQLWRTQNGSAFRGFPWLKALRPPLTHLGTPQLAVMRGHHDYVRAVAYSPDGRQIVSAGGSKLCVWDASSRKLLKVCSTPEARMLTFSPSGNMLYVGLAWALFQISLKSSLIVYDILSWEPLSCGRFDGGAVSSFSVSPNGELVVMAPEQGVFTRDTDCSIRVWNSNTESIVQRFEGHKNSVTDVAFFPDGQHVASSSRDRRVLVWDVGTGRQLACLNGHTNVVSTIAVSADGRHVFSGSEDGTVRVWDWREEREVDCFRAMEDVVTDIALSPNGHFLAAASSGGSIGIWNLSSRDEWHSLIGHQAAVLEVAFSPDGKQLASASRDGTLRVWDVGARRMRALERVADASGVAPPSKHRMSVEFSRATQKVFFGDDKSIRFWDSANNRLPQTLNSGGGEVSCVAVSQDHSRIAIGDKAGTVAIWELDIKCHHLVSLPSQRGDVDVVTFSPDGKRVACGYANGQIAVWDLELALPLFVLLSCEGRFDSVLWDSEPQDFLYSIAGKSFRIWDTKTGTCLKVVYAPVQWVSQELLSSRGKRVVLSDDEAVVIVRLGKSVHHLLKVTASLDRPDEPVAAPVGSFQFKIGSSDLVVQDVSTKEAVGFYPLECSSLPRVITQHGDSLVWTITGERHASVTLLKSDRLSD